MTETMTTLRDLARSMAEQMQLDPDDVERAIGDLRRTVGRYEDYATGSSLRTDLDRRVWAHLSDGAEWPWGAHAADAIKESKART